MIGREYFIGEVGWIIQLSAVLEGASLAGMAGRRFIHGIETDFPFRDR
jgi:hypothetical protein